jgi:hypothetical protein
MLDSGRPTDKLIPSALIDIARDADDFGSRSAEFNGVKGRKEIFCAMTFFHTCS